MHISKIAAIEYSKATLLNLPFNINTLNVSLIFLHSPPNRTHYLKR